ncbi:MAG: hypothetical protein WC821_02455 [archaeon]|jgi:hypothetical protein
MRRKLIPRITTVKGFLPTEQQTALNSGRAKQIFRTIVKRNAGTGPVDERKLRAIAKIAAQRAIQKESKTKLRSKLKVKLNAKPIEYYLLTSLTEIFVKKVQKQKTITFKNGARAQIKLIFGEPIYGFRSLGDAIRLVIIPAKASKEMRNFLNKPSPGDYIPDLEGSIGYLGITINQRGSFGEQSMLINNIQQRNLGKVRNLLKEYKNWKMEAIRTAEETARKMGLKNVMIISSESINMMHFDGKIVKDYKNLEQKLMEMGYTGKKVITEKHGRPPTRTYLVKTL